MWQYATFGIGVASAAVIAGLLLAQFWAALAFALLPLILAWQQYRSAVATHPAFPSASLRSGPPDAPPPGFLAGLDWRSKESVNLLVGAALGTLFGLLVDVARGN